MYYLVQCPHARDYNIFYKANADPLERDYVLAASINWYFTISELLRDVSTAPFTQSGVSPSWLEPECIVAIFDKLPTIESHPELLL